MKRKAWSFANQGDSSVMQLERGIHAASMCQEQAGGHFSRFAATCVEAG